MSTGIRLQIAVFTTSHRLLVLPFSRYISRYFFWQISLSVMDRAQGNVIPSKSTAIAHARRKQNHSDPSEERADEHDPHAVPKTDRNIDGVLLPELVLRHEDKGKICGEHDGRHNCGCDGQHEGGDPRQRVEHTTRGDDRYEREKCQTCGNRVEDEQDGESLEDEVRQLWFVCHDRNDPRIDCVSKFWTKAFAVIIEK